MQIRTTMRYLLTPVRMTITKKNTNNKCWQGCGEKGTLTHSNGCSYCGKQYGGFPKLRVELQYDTAILLLGIHPKSKALIQKGTRTPVFIAALFTIAKIWKQSQCLNTRWVDKGIHTMEYYSAIKNCHLQQHRRSWKALYTVRYIRQGKTNTCHFMWDLGNKPKKSD